MKKTSKEIPYGTLGGIFVICRYPNLKTSIQQWQWCDCDSDYCTDCDAHTGSVEVPIDYVFVKPKKKIKP